MPQDGECHKSDKGRDGNSLRALIALGANQPGPAGEPVQTLQAALRRLGDSQLAVERVSRFFATPCFPPGAGPDYVNAAAALCGAGSPGSVLKVLHAVEAEFGRAREKRWAGRSLDLDLLAVGDTILPDLSGFEYWRDLPLKKQMARAPDQLILPHPRLHERAFVLLPLCDIALDWRHPVSGLSVREMVARLPAEEKAGVRPLTSGE